MKYRDLRRAVLGSLIVATCVALLSAALMSLAGCRLQARDAVTGAAVGEPVPASQADRLPTTNPATGNPTEVVASREVDGEQVQRGADAAALFLPSPWRELLTAAGGAAGVLLAQRRTRRRRTPPAAAPADAPK